MILFADRFAAAFDFNPARFDGQLFSRGVTPGPGVQGMEKADREGTGRTKSGAFGRDVGDGGDFQPACDIEHRQGFTDERVLDAHDRIGLLGFRVADANALVKFLVDRNVNEFVNGGGDHSTAKAAIVRGQIAATTDKTHAKRSSADNHFRLIPGDDPINGLEKGLEGGVGLRWVLPVPASIAGFHEN